MKASQYVALKKPQNTTMCSAVLYPDGNIEECLKSHLKTLMLPFGNDIWDEIPDDISPLFYMTAYTGAVLIDYENQIYSEDLTKEQSDALEELYSENVILKSPKVIHCGNKALGIDIKRKEDNNA